MPARTPTSAVLVVNTGSRRGAEAFPRAVDGVRAGGIALTATHAIRSGDELVAVLERVMTEPPDLLVVGGGDGTIGCAAGHLAGTRTVLGVLPLGTANDLARTLQIPGDLRAACAVLTDGKDVDVDLGRADGRPFLNVASAGLSVAVTDALSPALKRRLGPLAYPLAAVRAYRRHEPFVARLEFPDGDHPTLTVPDVLQVSVGNGRHFGGGATVAPLADIDDHALDVAVVEQGRLRDHVSMARLVRSGHFVEHEKVHHRTTRRVRLVTDPPLRLNLDGEVVGGTPTTFEVQRNAVHVRVPQHATGARHDGD